MHRKTAATLATAAAMLGVIASAPTASAEANPPGCPKGYFCAYSGPDQTGTLVLKTAGNWSGQVGFRSVFNNGYAFPGADHVDMTYVYEGDSTVTSCFHYNPGPGQYKWTAPYTEVVYGVRWRGEC
ncbi:peptidase inhibitor family I36 protein [Streptomyces sp. NPDC102365]|uniref:peptidase inhibitor family I36 protein n=1 Tax=Streptomyces sp. NPDC102365 TaxID=3366162 RepID=UPI0038046110